MKKLLFLILLSPLANADMDYICKVKANIAATIEEQIESLKCERNNILYLTSYKTSDKGLLIISNRWCRFDRNRDIKPDVLSCVLYDTKPRTLKE